MIRCSLKWSVVDTDGSYSRALLMSPVLTVALKYLAVIRSHRWVTAMGTTLMVERGDAEVTIS